MQEHWELETGGSEFPVQAFTSYMADCLLDARREQRVGMGVFTGTAHSVKGLEFRVVLVLDGHWQLQQQDQLEEERRLFYVAMTRAKDCLVLFHRHGANNPHLRHISGEACLHREGPGSGSYPLRGYATLGLPDLFLSFAGRKGEDHRVHAVLQELHADDTVALAESKQRLTHKGATVASLSQRGRAKVERIAGSGIEGTVLAMVRRSVEDEDEQYREKNRTATWEVPLVELSWDRGVGAHGGSKPVGVRVNRTVTPCPDTDPVERAAGLTQLSVPKGMSSPAFIAFPTGTFPAGSLAGRYRKLVHNRSCFRLTGQATAVGERGPARHCPAPPPPTPCNWFQPGRLTMGCGSHC